MNSGFCPSKIIRFKILAFQHIEFDQDFGIPKSWIQDFETQTPLYNPIKITLTVDVYVYISSCGYTVAFCPRQPCGKLPWVRIGLGFRSGLVLLPRSTIDLTVFGRVFNPSYGELMGV